MIRIAHTTFSEEGYEIYGKRFIESFGKYWDIPLVVFYQGKLPPCPEGLLSQVSFVDLNRDADYRSFIDDFHDDPVANGHRGGKVDYRFQAVKFCHKVFAQTWQDRPACDQWIWIDADVETIRPIDEDFFAAACPSDVVSSHLGRKDWHHTECGFMAYNLPEAEEFLSQFRKLYVGRKLFTLGEWHDSFAWDHIRRQVGGEFHNLSNGVPGLHVWPHTILGRYMEHYKGGLAKVRAYGATI